MALKKFDVPDIDDAISEAKDDEQRKEKTAHAEKITYALEYFTKKAPDILKNMSDVISQLDARKFASILREELKNAADEMAHRFNSKIEPMVKRAESADRRISVPTMAAYIILATIVWLFIFLIMVIYANTKIQSGDLTALITRVRDNESPNGCSEKRHRLSGDPVGSPDFLPSCLPPEDELPA